jgi:gluconolactonase
MALALLISCTAHERTAEKDGPSELTDGGMAVHTDDAGREAGQSNNRDGGENSSQEAGSPPRDAGLDARQTDASSSDMDANRDSSGSGNDAENGENRDAGRRTQICGDTATWPRPFSGATIAAAQVGSSSFGFLEGPVWIAEQGVLLFSDMDMSNVGTMGPPARIRRLRPPSSFDVFVQASNSNGLALWRDEAVIAATHDTQALSLFALADGARTQLEVLSDGKRLNSPNDLTVRSDGTVYFTDPSWQKTDARPSETMRKGVYRLPSSWRADGPNNALLVDESLDEPNGVALSPDERTLYVGSRGSEIWKFNVAADGSVSNRTMFANTGSSDGMTVDCAGNLYVTSGTVEVFEPGGMRLGEITLGGNPTNVAFGGVDRKTLYITAGSQLYSVVLNVPGYPY